MVTTIGKMRNRIEIHNRTTARDDYGAAVPTYASAGTVWGSISPISSGEKYQAEANDMHTTHRVVIRSNSSVTGTSRLIFDGRTFEVTGIRDLNELGRFMEITCEEVE